MARRCGLPNVKFRIDGSHAIAHLNITHYLLQPPAEQLLKADLTITYSIVAAPDVRGDGHIYGACLACKHAFMSCSQAAAHVVRCKAWLAVKKIPPPLQALNVLERRSVALIQLYQAPDLKDGPRSIAGRFSPQAGGRKGTRVPFCFKGLEERAFPVLFVDIPGWSGTTQEELFTYTMMRLYSADPRWRSDPDYVVFSLHRLAAFGDKGARSAVAKLPPQLPISRADEITKMGLVLKGCFAPL